MKHDVHIFDVFLEVHIKPGNVDSNTFKMQVQYEIFSRYISTKKLIIRV